MIIGHQESFPEERAAVRSPPDTTDYDCRAMTTEGPTVSHPQNCFHLPKEAYGKLNIMREIAESLALRPSQPLGRY